MAPLSEQIATLEAKAAVVDEIRVLLGGTADGVSAAQIAHLERELATAKAIIEARDNEIANLAQARRDDGRENDKLRADLARVAKQMDDAAKRVARIEKEREDTRVLEADLAAHAHVIGRVTADLRSAAQRLGERYDGDAESDEVADLATKIDEAVAGLLEDYECAKADEKPAKRKDSKTAAKPATSAAPTPAVENEEPDGDVAPPTVGDPFVIMRTIPTGRQVYREGDKSWHMLAGLGGAAALSFATEIDAEAVKRAHSLRRTKVCRLSEALAGPSTKANPPRVEVLVDLGAEGAFVVGTHDTNGKRAWLTTSQGLMPEHDGQRVRTFTEVQADADEQGTPIAEFEHLDEAKAAAKDLAKSMPNAGGVCVVEVHDVGALVVAEERWEAAE